MLITLIKI